MITRPTCFVLGAGAHCPYGFPDGHSLTIEIIKSLPLSRSDNTAFSNMLLVAPRGSPYDRITDSRLVRFRELLSSSGYASIDAFLNTHKAQDGFPEIGKAAIAFQLMPHEFMSDWGQENEGNGDWLSFLFRTMLVGCHSPEAFVETNKVGFVTFNYDRTLEEFLCVRIASSFAVNPEQAWELAKKFPIVHVYGSLGDFSPNMPQLHLARRRKSPEFYDYSFFLKAADSIRLIYDDRHSSQPEIAAAMGHLRSAACVCFLGFGFDQDNIDRLKLTEVCKGKSFPVFASGFKVGVPLISVSKVPVLSLGNYSG